MNIKSTFRITDCISIRILISLVSLSECKALEPSEVLVLSNSLAAKSNDLAQYYMRKRAIPARNHVTLRVTDRETVAREDYEKRVAEPVRRFLETETGGNIRCLVLLYGMPIRIGSSPGTGGKEDNELAGLRNKKHSLEVRLESAADENERKRLE